LLATGSGTISMQKKWFNYTKEGYLIK